MATFETTAAPLALRPIDRDAAHPVFYVDSAADLQAIASAAFTRVSLLDDWLKMLATSRSESIQDPSEVADMLRPMCQDVRGLLLVLVDRLSAESPGANPMGADRKG